MPEKKVRVNVAGIGLVDGVEVNVSESTERWTDITLEDGTTLRVKVVILGALRVDGRYDSDGNPVYSLRMTPVMAVTGVPEGLRRPTPTGAQKPN